MASSTNAPTNSTLEKRIKAVSKALAVEATKTTFAVGGRVHNPVGKTTLRWDTDQPNRSRKASLPVDRRNLASIEAFMGFLQDSELATFEIGERNVIDESYRKVRKMSADRFSTSFNLSEWEIMAIISQALAHGSHGGMKAELDRVNVHFGSSGKFKPHVDSSRSKDQMGSLVVCLPSLHEGGQLAVRHQGREVIFDWAAESAVGSVVQWAAFISDCEHQVLQVTSGHRITLTYNLYWTSQISRQVRVLEPQQLAFFSALRDVLSDPDFLPKGGMVGFTCAHAYPHRSRATAGTLEDNLKGIDMLVYQALKQLLGPNADVRVTDVVDDEVLDDYLNDRSPSEPKDAVGNMPLQGPYLNDHYSEFDAVDPAKLKDHGHSGWDRQNVVWLNYHPLEEQENQELAVAYITVSVD
ncbi:hypothetical protein QBC42DRAFT_236506 [Cladorrhinum samala]|uniref:Prolyl 4-hydroxylase alpha subunit Fe(2+) 2OG dioxygenase domain-containing protein n=1 Tax=Cladorrhinum samala TaxID=585594 RepID=A0AAV9H9C0_9PEZI|nr:hypothetical protein QBC42DRAFT_236506 [Cladorrhinum samala]